ncbi:hypothetical protein SMGD1_1016 [Sulfurimonas gotlandica GD1]|uniref:STAS domain-containing protein n=1 Tax=Sulfurimonas gotlandica (strain DSM 19862 / JCM 16533 / GD1) TaxID=929558 RepID=B6BGB4_SULGG|nr:hypothetical protein [Sulfurimonas gotlandica]EDZ62988.1 conserved hypothetical protein [Sulfurimonas gotlandica GD1]EHP29540.1 hypothetical protein SMGD1_1016 [Sulfurimonas gotlandica GD1]
MEITSSSNTINITGNIKSINDFSQIKNLVDSVVTQHKNITINIIDSLSITSSVIGYFNKLILKDNINIEMRVGNEQLMHLLADLNLASTFKARRA